LPIPLLQLLLVPLLVLVLESVHQPWMLLLLLLLEAPEGHLLLQLHCLLVPGLQAPVGGQQVRQLLLLLLWG
jgi:hypothetical protein